MTVVERIRDRIAREGPLTFADFMHESLYGPEGYYASRVAMGFGGDFLTAPETTPLFGATLSRLASSAWRALRKPDEFEVVDVGAGTGALLRDLIHVLEREDPECARAAMFVAIEVDGAAQRAQAKSLAGLRVSRAVSLEALGPVTGLIVANELLDAMPFHLVTRRGKRVLELRVGADRDGFAFVEGPPSGPRLVDEAPDVAEGERAAVPLAAYEWIERLGSALVQGIAVIVDYPSRAVADVRTYFRHTAAADALERVGQQDLTAALDFARLRRHAEAAGLEVIDDRTQAEFLKDLGIDERIRDIADPGATDPKGQLRAASARNAARSILDPGGMGAFSVLVLAKGLRL